MWSYTLSLALMSKGFENYVGVQETSVDPVDLSAFVISYENTSDSMGAKLSRHVDSSLWTMNVCIYNNNCANSIKFWVNPPQKERRASANSGKVAEILYEETNYAISASGDMDKPIVEVSLRQGDALIHRGDIFHETVGECSIGGGRSNLVLWFKKGKYLL